MTWKKYLLWFIIVFPFAIQLIRPKGGNISNDNTHHISKKYTVNNEVGHLLKVACYDCHSNFTDYPSHYKYQPLALYMDSHIRNGKKKLNFSEFTKKRIAVQNHKFEEIIEYTGEKKMPLASYSYFGLHPEAKLTDDQRNIIIKWAKAQMDTLKNNYPADSLVLKKH